MDVRKKKQNRPAAKGGRGAGGPVPVVTDKVIKKDAPLSIDAIGAVEFSVLFPSSHSSREC